VIQVARTGKQETEINFEGQNMHEKVILCAETKSGRTGGARNVAENLSGRTSN
jgi:hypothetical protein